MLEPLFTTSQRAAESAARRSPLAPLALVSHSPGLVSGFAEAVGIALETGMENVERRALALGDLLRENLAAVPGCSLLGPRASGAACGLVTVELEGWPPAGLVEALAQRFRIVARVVHNPDGVRFSTAYFNTEDEIGQVAQALSELRRQTPVKPTA
jgi:selenocysteine lyase/cysteine desulfurase